MAKVLTVERISPHQLSALVEMDDGVNVKVAVDISDTTPVASARQTIRDAVANYRSAEARLANVIDVLIGFEVV